MKINILDSISKRIQLINLLDEFVKPQWLIDIMPDNVLLDYQNTQNVVCKLREIAEQQIKDLIHKA